MSSLLSLLKDFKINDFIFVDVGAKGTIEYIEGVESISEIHAFEPNPQEFEFLERKYFKHPFKYLHLNEVGLSDSIGKSSLMISNNSSMSSLLKPDLINYKKHFGNYKAYKNWASCIETSHSIEINLNTLDTYFKQQIVIDFLKIDTQGSELSILKGAEKMLESGLIKIIKVEVSTVATYEHQPLFSDIDIYLRKFNYCLVDFLTFRENPSYLLGEDQEVHFAPCGDAIYCLLKDVVSEKQDIKKAVILNYLGYSSLAIDILESLKLNSKIIKELLEKSSNRRLNIWKKILKDILPPVVIKLFKKSLF